MKIFIFSLALLFLAPVAKPQGVTLLVDFGPFTGRNDKPSGNEKKTKSLPEDFARADAQVDLSAPVNVLNYKFGEIKVGDRTRDLSGTGITADLILNKSIQGFGAFDGAYFGKPILTSYLFVNKNSSSITIASLEEIQPGETVTVTAWGGGDKPGQDTKFHITYNEADSPKQTVIHGSPPEQAFASFDFVKSEGVDELTLHYGNPKNFAGFGGFSLTSSGPREPLEPE